MKGYKALEVWQQAVELTDAIYDLADDLPKTERWVWELQLKRAVTGISANIAEGYGTGTWANFRRHVRLAEGSASELESHLLSMQRVDVGSPDELDKCLYAVESVLRLINGFESYLTTQIRDEDKE